MDAYLTYLNFPRIFEHRYRHDTKFECKLKVAEMVSSSYIYTHETRIKPVVCARGFFSIVHGFCAYTRV